MSLYCTAVQKTMENPSVKRKWPYSTRIVLMARKFFMILGRWSRQSQFLIFSLNKIERLIPYLQKFGIIGAGQQRALLHWSLRTVLRALLGPQTGSMDLIHTRHFAV